MSRGSVAVVPGAVVGVRPARAQRAARAARAPELRPGAGDPGAADAIDARPCRGRRVGLTASHSNSLRGFPLCGSATGDQSAPPLVERATAPSVPTARPIAAGRVWNTMSRNTAPSSAVAPAGTTPPTRRKILPLRGGEPEVVAAAVLDGGDLLRRPGRDLRPDGRAAPGAASAPRASDGGEAASVRTRVTTSVPPCRRGVCRRDPPRSEREKQRPTWTFVRADRAESRRYPRRCPCSSSATDLATSAASSASTPRARMSPASPTSRSTPCSTAGRSRRASPRRRAATSWPCATRASSTRSSTSRSCARCTATWRSATSATRPRARTRGRTRSPSGAPTGARWRSPTTATSSTRSSCTPSCARPGVTFRSTSDSEIIAALLSTHPAERIEDAVADVMRGIEGAYSTVVMTKDRVVAFRDPAGLRPLSLGHARRPLLRRVGDVRVRHHRRPLPARRPARRGRLAVRARDRDADGGRGRAPARCACSSTSTSRGPTRGSAARCCRSRAGGWARSSRARRRPTPTS